MFENKLTHNGINYSRYIASWRRLGGKIYRGGLFERWLREKEGLTDEEINDILQLAECGKLELENSVKCFLDDERDGHHNLAQFLYERRVALMGGYFEDCKGTNFDIISERYQRIKQKYE